jgi:tetratricopeptide (TPR) repeat protein
VLAFVTVAAVPGPARPTALDDEIAFYQDRIARDPGDFITPTWLGAAYLRKARANGDPIFVARAVAACERSLALQPEHVPGFAVLAAARNAQHRFPEAVAAALHATERDPASADAWAVLGDALLSRGALTEAREAYDRLHARAPGLPSLQRRAAWRVATGDDDGALADWSRAIAAGLAAGAPPAEVAWVHLQRGAHQFARGRLDEAESDYEAARRLDADADAILERLAELRAAQGRYDEATALFDQVATRVDRPDLQQMVGDFFVFIGKRAEATPWHDRAEAGYQRSVAAGEVLYYHHLASFYADVRPRPAMALEWARKDLLIRQSSAAHDGNAWALHKNGQPDEARAAIDRALAPAAEPHVLEHAALIYEAAGASAAGAVLLLKAYRLNPKLDRFHAHR